MCRIVWLLFPQEKALFQLCLLLALLLAVPLLSTCPAFGSSSRLLSRIVLFFFFTHMVIVLLVPPLLAVPVTSFELVRVVSCLEFRDRDVPTFTNWISAGTQTPLQCLKVPAGMLAYVKACNFAALSDTIASSLGLVVNLNAFSIPYHFRTANSSTCSR